LRFLRSFSKDIGIADPIAPGGPMHRTERQHATVTLMIDIAEAMAAQTMRIARRDVVEVGDVTLTEEEDARLAESLRHIDTAAHDLHRLRRAD
jgi:hypothetical protein